MSRTPGRSEILPAPAIAASGAPRKLILASASPRRQQLLADAGYVFDIDVADIDENAYPPTLTPAQIAEHLAKEKARVVAGRHPDDAVLAADTVVTFGDRVLGKPLDEADALRMLTLLSGTTHIVITGVAVVREGGVIIRSARVMTAVRMRLLKPVELSSYIATGDWRGKAGGYGIQDRDPFVTRVTGSQTNVVGLPMTLTRRMLRDAGISANDETQRVKPE